VVIALLLQEEEVGQVRPEQMEKVYQLVVMAVQV
jgi:hypothetical protein